MAESRSTIGANFMQIGQLFYCFLRGGRILVGRPVRDVEIYRQLWSIGAEYASPVYSFYFNAKRMSGAEVLALCYACIL
jgi:hypothetical protein